MNAKTLKAAGWTLGIMFVGLAVANRIPAAREFLRIDA